MIKIYYCDDDKEILTSMESLLLSYKTQRGLEIVSEGFKSAEDLIVHGASDADILILDIAMDGMSGMELAKKLRAEGNDACLMFVTTMVQYAVEGYDVHAFSFIQKPFDKEKLFIKLDEAVAYCRQKKGVVLTIKNEGATYRIDSKDIIYIDVLDHQVRIVTNKETLLFYASLSDLEKQLPEGMFFRVHNSYVVNMAFVQTVKKSEIIMRCGDMLPLSKHRRVAFLTAFSDFVGKGYLF